MAYSDVQVTFEIGHRSSLRSKITPEGFTHDWEVFIRGVDGADISQFVDKVIFYLHETFTKPKRVIREPPYCVKESGYAGFTLNLDICFKNKDEPKKLECNYDLSLPQKFGPPISNVIKQKVTFPNPSGDLRKKLIKAGGIGVNGGDGGGVEKVVRADGSSKSSNIQSSKSSVSSQGKTKPSGETVKKHKIKEPKIDDYRPSIPFAELFGTPIKTSKVPIDAKKSSSSSKLQPVVKSSSKSAEKPSDKSAGDVKVKHSSQKEVKKEKESGLTEDKKEKRDKVKETDKKLPRAPSPNTKLSKEELKKIDENNKDSVVETKSEKKKKDKKNREEKVKKDKRKEHEKSQEKSSDKLKDKDSKKHSALTEIVRESEKSEPSKDKEKQKDSEKEKQKHKHKKKEKDKSKKSKEQDRDRTKKDKIVSKEKSKKANDEINLSFQTQEPHSPRTPPLSNKSASEKAISPNIQNKEKTSGKRPLSKLLEEISDDPDSSDSNLSRNSVDDFIEFPPAKSKDTKSDESVLKRIKKEHASPSADRVGASKAKQKDYVFDTQKDISDNYLKDEKRRKRKISRETDETETVAKSIKEEVCDTQEIERPPSQETTRTVSTDQQYRSELKELQRKIMNLEDDDVLQRLVNVVTGTGQYEVTKKTLDFDLCALDKSTVRRLQEFFRNL